MDRADLERLDRESLVLRAQAAGIKRARVLTRPELVDELLRLDAKPGGAAERELKRSRGFFGLARDLLSRVVERGLHLPDAAERFRAALVDPVPNVPRPEAQAIPTVTLAEIYAAQGHRERAIDTLKRVLEEEPDHLAARALLEKLEATDYVPPEAKLPPEPEVEAVAVAEEAAEEEEEDDGEAAISTPPPPAPPAPLTPEPVTSRVPSPPTASQPLVVVRDRCLAIPCGQTHYVWWQLAPASRRLAEESFFFVRVVTILPGWDGPRVATKDIAADPYAGELLLRDLEPGGVVRVAIGFVPDGDFVPVAHSPAFEGEAPGSLRHWTFGPTDGESPDVLADEVVRAAAERAVRLTSG